MNERTEELNSLEERFEKIAEQFANRIRSGETPSLDQYIQENPELEEKVRRLFPILELMESNNSSPDDWSQIHSIESILEEQLASPVGSEIGDFKILREIGRGGMGIVYLAEQKNLDRNVALKLLPESAQFDTRRRKRFQEEARSAAMLHHTNIVPIFDIGQFKGVSYQVMQFIDGQSLSDVISATTELLSASPDLPERKEMAAATTVATRLLGPMLDTDVESKNERGLDSESGPSNSTTPSLETDSKQTSKKSESSLTKPRPKSKHYWDTVSKMGFQVASALVHAHSKGICHRDIKPSNLLVSADSEVWVTDFGLAKSINSPELTRTGEIIGTLRYMSPEQMNGHADERSDLFALGLTLYELLTLEPAYDAQEREVLIRQVIDANPKRIQNVNRHVPKDLATIVQKLIAPEPRSRYQTAQEVANELDRFQKGEPIQARQATTVERTWKWCKRRPLITGLIACLFLSLLTGTLVATYQWRNTAAALEVAERNTKIANQQNENALETINDVLLEMTNVFDKASGTSSIEQEAKKNMVNSVLRGLGRVSKHLMERGGSLDCIYSKTLVWAHIDLGETYLHIGREGFENGQDLAETEFIRARAVAEKLAAEQPDNLAVQACYAEALQKLAYFKLTKEEFEVATQFAAQAVEISKSLAYSKDKARADYRELLLQQNLHGVIEFRRFNLDVAKAIFTEATATIKDGTAFDKTTFEEEKWEQYYIPEVTRNLTIVSNLPAIRKDLQKAFEFDKSLTPRLLYDCAAWQAFDGDHISACDALELMEKIEELPVIENYHVACGYGRCINALLNKRLVEDLNENELATFKDYKTKAIAGLNSAKDKGLFKDASLIGLLGRDRDFDAIRSHDEFQAFFKGLVKNAN